MGFLPLQSTNVAIQRLFPYLGPEGLANAVARDLSPSLITESRQPEQCCCRGWRDTDDFPQAEKYRGEVKDHKEASTERLESFINPPSSLEVEIGFYFI